jgi:hypothetical protein
MANYIDPDNNPANGRDYVVGANVIKVTNLNGSTTSVLAADQVAFIAQQVGDFANLAAVTTAYNDLLTALKTSGVMEPTA